MSFPKYKWFGLVTDGWEDRGEVKGHDEMRGDRVFTITPTHTFCGATVHIGREGDGTFKFCPTCMKKI